VYDGPDGPDGFVTWTATSDFSLNGDAATVRVHDLHAATDEAYQALWAYLSQLDLIGTVALPDRPVDEPVRWRLANGRALRQTYTGDYLWLRLLDVPAALSARRYRVPGELVLELVDDDIGGFAAGRFALGGGPDGASCVAAPGAAADLRVHQRALAAAYLGGSSLLAQQLGGMLVEELRPGALRQADAMFSTSLAPWCATGF
jgi:predicted acetyltransferase